VRPLAVFFITSVAAQAQLFTQRGYFEMRSFLFPDEVPGDSAHLVGESLLRWESTLQPASNFRIHLSLDGRVDTHRQFERSLHLDLADRGPLRPALSVRRLSAVYNKAGWTVELGRQFIRWGKADLLNPTDRFAPRDYLNVLSNEFLGVTAARVTYERGAETLDAVFAPYFTPSRMPLPGQRWAALPATVSPHPLVDAGSRLPSRGQVGLRWSHLGAGYEMSLSFYDGFNHLPLLAFETVPVPQPYLAFGRYFAHMRMTGADAAVPLRWFTVKGEAAYFTSRTPAADEYLQYVLQLERTSGEWTFVGGYAGEYVTEKRSQFDFAPDRGLTRTFLGRAGYNIDANRSVAVEGAVRRNGAGVYAKFEYSQAIGRRWRATAAVTILRGREDDFLGQYRRNSNAQLILRYSF
jgi:hypothetical protein